VTDTELGGVPIPAGAIVLVVFASGNRDDSHFSDPEAFDITRERVKHHLAFGHGIHLCLGAPLARVEGRIAFDRLFARLPNLRFSPKNDFAPMGPTVIFRGLEKLSLEFDPPS
jgi:cytochrome P450